MAAEPVSKVAWNVETLKLVKHGDADQGKAKAAMCESCHGAAQAATPNPYLQGQLATYLFKQMQDYKSGVRANPIMQGMVGNLKDQDMADIAAYYAEAELPAPQPAKGSTDTAEALAKRGDPARILTPCSVCHGGGKGQPIDNPALAGQKAAYLEQTLLAYRSGERKNDIYGRMRTLAARLSPAEIAELARYYAAEGR
jgi:cytochrome c553